MTPANDLELWYHASADEDWNRALPLGNGRLGAMVFGNIIAERIQLNEDSLYNGGPRDRNNPSCLEHLPEIKTLMREGRVGEARGIVNDAMAGIPDSMRCYEPLVDLWIRSEPDNVPLHTSPEDDASADSYVVPTFDGKLLASYRRSLDLSEAVAKVDYTLAGVEYTRECLASFTEPVVATHLKAVGGGLNLKIRLERGPRKSYSTRYADTVEGLGSDGILLRGRTGGEGGLSFAVCLRANAEGGTMKMIGETLVVRGAQKLTLVVAAATTFRESDPTAVVQASAARAIGLSWVDLREAHVASYQKIFGRVSLKLGDEGEKALPTDQRLAKQAEGASDPTLAALYFQFGRYLLLSSSRDGSMPPNLQGIWNQDFWPAWGSKYTININLEMNYWPVEVANLPECLEPLTVLLERMLVNGRKTAREMYGCRGFTAHHNTDLWADTAPTDRNLAASYWCLGGAWLALHLWEHYAFGGDREFLTRIYPILHEASLFFLDYLEDNGKGQLVIPVTASPENVYKLPNGETSILSYGCKMDGRILDELFTATRSAANLLECDADFCQELEQARRRLPRSEVGADGTLMEWLEDYAELDPEHRHCSHLFGLHPGNEIHPVTTPDLAEAARKTLERRGDGGTGWSLAWKVLFWARLGDGKRAGELLRALLNPVMSAELDNVDRSYLDGGTYPNLFCAHPPFQIDGNLGGCAAIAEMLLQSHLSHQDQNESDMMPIIHLLPALPEPWSDGEVSGLRARGGFELNFSWSGGAVHRVSIMSANGGSCILRIGETDTKLTFAQEETKLLDF